MNGYCIQGWVGQELIFFWPPLAQPLRHCSMPPLRVWLTHVYDRVVTPRVGAPGPSAYVTGHLKALVVSARVQLVPPITRADNLLSTTRFLTERPSARTERTPLTPHDAQEHSALRPSSDFLPAFLGGLRGCRLSLSEAGEAAYLQSNRR